MLLRIWLMLVCSNHLIVSNYVRVNWDCDLHSYSIDSFTYQCGCKWRKSVSQSECNQATANFVINSKSFVSQTTLEIKTTFIILHRNAYFMPFLPTIKSKFTLVDSFLSYQLYEIISNHFQKKWTFEISLFPSIIKNSWRLR